MKRQRIRLVVLQRFFFAFKRHNFFCRFYRKKHKICCFRGVKTLAIIITSGNDTLKVVGFKGTHIKSDKINDLCQNIRQDFDIYRNIDHQKAKKLKKKQRKKE